jgi:hypothetical protein
MGRRRGFFAEITHSIQQAERAERRRQRELLARQRHVQRLQDAVGRERERLQTALDKERERAHAELEAETYQNQVQVLLSVHRDATPHADWAAASQAPKPEATGVDRAPLELARTALRRYSPGLFDRVLRRTEKRRAALRDAVAAAEADHRRRQAQAASEHEAAIRGWEEQLAFAKRVLEGDLAAYQQVLEESDCFEELNGLGCAVAVQWGSAKVARASVRAQEADVVPAEEKTVTARGKLAVKKMAAGRASEIYQDFICGAALRTARELLAILPLDAVVVDVYTSLLNSASGHFEDAAVLSVYCPRERLERINFANADASEAIRTMRHAMSFKRGKGMDRVEPLH